MESKDPTKTWDQLGQSSCKSRGLEGKKKLLKKRGKGLKIDEVGSSSYLHIWGLPDSRKNKLTRKIEI